MHQELSLAVSKRRTDVLQWLPYKLNNTGSSTPEETVRVVQLIVRYLAKHPDYRG